IRMIVEHPDFFLRQMRAILRAGVAGQVRLLLPMLTTLDELRRVRRLLLRARRDLTDANTPWKNVGVGVMIEVPAAALCIDHFLDHVDFISIGTNDLVQYLTAADRDNPRVAYLCEPLSPPVLRLLWAVVHSCVVRGVPVTVCGEMAGRPLGVLALLAMGVTNLSMSPAFVPVVKDLVQSLSLQDLKPIVHELMTKRTAREVKRLLRGVLRELHPRLADLGFE
ncbi:MAG: putative PEP-binding protein, partial [Planctomycetia bacterium]